MKGDYYMATETIKSTINLNKHDKEQLEYLVSINEINSVTDGINQAIANFIKDKRKKLYAAKMEEAKSDEDFLTRTMKVQKEFEKSDSEVEGLITEENYEW